jgi:hypothetical protein
LSLYDAAEFRGKTRRGNLSTITVDKFVGKILMGRVSLLFVTLFSLVAIF